uniref:Uncharacterized protein n=1 Tax=Anopheles albimanus TaxID=7167 RepID=A0A182F0N7_ANOAL
MDQQQYCLKWSNYSSNLAAAFSNLFDSAILTDVTLVCGAPRMLVISIDRSQSPEHLGPLRDDLMGSGFSKD